MSQIPIRAAFRATRPAIRHREPSSFFRACRSRDLSSTSASRPSLCRAPVPRSSQSLPISRTFSSSAPARATVVLHNPRVDDEGNDMTIEISERAAKRLKQITSAPPQKNTLAPSSSSPDSHLRVTVTSGGCHGFQYLMALEDASKLDSEEDTIFEAQAPTAAGGEAAGKAQVVMDLPSLELLKGSTVDFTTELIGSQFKIVGNPRARSSCGCGTSFDIE